MRSRSAPKFPFTTDSASFNMYRSNRSFNMPSRTFPGHLTSLPSGEEGIWLSESSRGWGIWSPCFRGGEFELHPRFHAKSWAWRAIYRGRGVRGFSWKRLCLCSQLVTRKGFKQALWRIWSIYKISKFLTLDSGFECMNVFYCCVYDKIQYLYRWFNTTT